MTALTYRLTDHTARRKAEACIGNNWTGKQTFFADGCSSSFDDNFDDGFRFTFRKTQCGFCCNIDG